MDLDDLARAMDIDPATLPSSNQVAPSGTASTPPDPPEEKETVQATATATQNAQEPQSSSVEEAKPPEKPSEASIKSYDARKERINTIIYALIRFVKKLRPGMRLSLTTGRGEMIERRLS